MSEDVDASSVTNDSTPGSDERLALSTAVARFGYPMTIDKARQLDGWQEWVSEIRRVQFEMYNWATGGWGALLVDHNELDLGDSKPAPGPPQPARWPFGKESKS